MKMLKTLVILLACVGFIGAMDCASSSAAESGARAPLVDHDVRITTVGGEVCFTPEQLMKLDFLYGMLEEEAPVERGKDIDLREICAERPCLRYEGLHHIPALVDCVTRADIDHYLSEISPEQACCAVLALHFLRTSQNVFIWAHAYIINRLVNDNLFAVRCLSLSETRENLEHIIAFCNNEPVPASIGSLRTMLLKNGLSTSLSCICFGASNFLFSPDGSRLAVEREIDGNWHVVLHRTSDGSEIKPIFGCVPVFNPDGSRLAVTDNTHVVLHRTSDGREIRKILGWGTVFSSDGSRLAVTREIDGNWYVVLHQTSDYSEIKPILGYVPVFSPDGSRLAVSRTIDGATHVVLHRTSDGNEIKRIPGWFPVFSPDGSRLAVSRTIDGATHVVLHRTSDGNEIGKILGRDSVSSPDGSRLAVERLINGNRHVVLHRTSDGNEIGSPILGCGPVFNPDGSRLAVSRTIDGATHVVLHRTSDGNEIGKILGYVPVFSPDGSRLAVEREIDGVTHVVLHRTSDGSKIKNTILGYNPVFSPDGSLLKITYRNETSLYFTDDGNALLPNVKDVQFGTNGTIAYQDGDRIICINPISINSAEYVLALAAIHLGHELIETAWRNIFDQAPDELKTFVRAKTGKFIS